MAASPQTEDGYIKIADELWEAFSRIHLWDSDWRVLFAIIRKTYGFSRCEDTISFSQIEKMTGLHRPRINEAIKRLEARKIIIVDRSGYTNRLKVQKDYEEWGKDSTTDSTSTVGRTSTKERTKDSTTDSTKTSTTDSTHNKQYNIMSHAEGSDALRLATLLRDLIRSNDPKAKNPDLQKWAIHIDRLIRLDERTPEEIEATIRWCQADDFESSNVLSTEKLRKRFGQLWQKSQKGSRAPQCRNALPGYPPLQTQAPSELERCSCPACRAELERRAAQ